MKAFRLGLLPSLCLLLVGSCGEASGPREADSGTVADAGRDAGIPLSPGCEFGCGWECPELCDGGVYDYQDDDTGTTPWFSITHFFLPEGDGFDIDGINDAMPGVPGGGLGAIVPGCGKIDFPYGKENALGDVASANPAWDVGGAIASALLQADDGGVEGAFSLRLRLTQVRSATAASDSLIQIELEITDAGGDVSVIQGRGSLSNHVVFAYFSFPFALPMRPRVPSSACEDGSCAAAGLAIELAGVRMLLNLNADNSVIGPKSMIGGFVFLGDSSAEYEATNPRGFDAVFAAFAADTHLLPSVRDDVLGVFGVAADLRRTADGAIVPCTGTSLADTNANSFSFAFGLDSLP